MGKKIIHKKTVFVGVSGGVDSSVAALLLQQEGYTVVGVFIRTWQPDFIKCTWQDERRDAMRVCAYLSIPFLECDAEEAYKKGVADYMIDEYKKGNTPNPDVMCNREVKFGVFWDFAKAHGADYIATGHYAVVKNKEKKDYQKLFTLSASPDSSKDQSYFLWTLTQEDLSHILFPIGHLHKTKVRILAKKYNLPTAHKKDSQGVCFLGPLDMKDFLSHYIAVQKGEVLDENNQSIGTHDGAVFFTLGERHGFTITKNSVLDKPYYVVSKDIACNTITVAMKEKKDVLSHATDFSGKEVGIQNTNWIVTPPEEGKTYTAQIRYHGEYLKCIILPITSTESRVILMISVVVSSGQSIVVYDKLQCIGGGVVL